MKISIHKARRTPPDQRGVSILGVEVRQGSGSDFCVFECPSCRRVTRLTEDDVRGLYQRAKVWDEEGFNLRGVLECPKASCQRPFSLEVGKGNDIVVGSPSFYTQVPGPTKKAEMCTFAGDVWETRRD